jgi:hypothetical protein
MLKPKSNLKSNQSQSQKFPNKSTFKKVKLTKIAQKNDGLNFFQSFFKQVKSQIIKPVEFLKNLRGISNKSQNKEPIQKYTKNDNKTKEKVNITLDKPFSKKNEKNPSFIIFRPKESELAKINSKSKQEPSKFFHLGQKNLAQILGKNKNDIWQSTSLKINLFLKKFQVLSSPSRFFGTFGAAFLVIFLIYISFFDTFFLIKNYNITFSEGSYLGQNERQIILNKFSQTKVLGIFPVNQFWFVNDRNLTLLSQNVLPEVIGVQIFERVWPNKISIKITTSPILLTLKTMENGQNKWWRVLADGRILTQDEAGLQENLVTVDRPINFDQKNFSLQKYPIFSDIGQLNRLYFTVNMASWLKELKVETSQTVLPSLNIADKDVFIILKNGTKLYFDSGRFSSQTQRDRLQSIFESKIGDQAKNGELAYIDFRISKKVFVCARGQTCEKERLDS